MARGLTIKIPDLVL
jgi:hypothetical protein